MARPLRILYAGAWYHVMNRGRRRERVFLNEKDYGGFLDLVKESIGLWNIRVAADCLMSNHDHLLLHIRNHDLPRCMRHIDGIYTQRRVFCKKWSADSAKTIASSFGLKSYSGVTEAIKRARIELENR